MNTVYIFVHQGVVTNVCADEQINIEMFDWDNINCDEKINEEEYEKIKQDAISILQNKTHCY